MRIIMHIHLESVSVLLYISSPLAEKKEGTDILQPYLEQHRQNQIKKTSLLPQLTQRTERAGVKTGCAISGKRR